MQSNLTFEFELVSEGGDAVYQNSDFTWAFATDCSTDWTITYVQVKARVITLDNIIQNQITQHLTICGALSF